VTAPMQTDTAPSRTSRAHRSAALHATDPARATRQLERGSAMAQLTFVVDELAARYPELGLAVVRQEALDVLCLGTPDRLTPTLVGRLVEARLLALL
jgi:hypothetical protein